MSAASRTPEPDRTFTSQTAFRELNDRVAALSEGRDARPRFICECLREDCDATIVLSLGEYAKVRSDPACFIVQAGHEDVATQDVLERRGECSIVRQLELTAVLSRRAGLQAVEGEVPA